jgi:hypothetical protein
MKREDFTGNFIYFRPRAGSYVIGIEVDESMADAVLERLGGLPKAGISRPVAVFSMGPEDQQ